MPDREMKEYIVKMKYGMEIGYGQELVRCKDCKHGKIYVGRHGYHVACEIIEHPSHDLDWFCADGERKSAQD